MYFLKHLEEFLDFPARFQHTVLDQTFEIAELAHLTKTELVADENSLKIYRDNSNVLNTATEIAEAKGMKKGLAKGKKVGLAEGLEKGRAEGELKIKREMEQQTHETARQLKADGILLDSICKLHGSVCQSGQKIVKSKTSSRTFHQAPANPAHRADGAAHAQRFLDLARSTGNRCLYHLNDSVLQYCS